MSQIKILPEVISNKIAAGEVVERPASVVKELVENALDANSTRIIIEVEQGGRSLIRVADNGTGMSHDDALLALERYATSKIYKDRDLCNIRTLGFRGEALPSIAAVSKFTLVSRDESSAAGTEIRVEGGKIRKVFEVGAPRGTLISVAQLFYNTPARRKFLKTIHTEMGHLADTVSHMALARPDVQFKLLHNAKIANNWTAVSDPIDRIADLLGRDAKAQLHPVGFETDGVMISGWISTPRYTRKTSRGIHVYVNGRYVRDKIIQHALFEGYAQRLVKGQYPVAVLFIKVAFDRVDVNVHPAKSEVRFVEHRKVHEQSVAHDLPDTPGPHPVDTQQHRKQQSEAHDRTGQTQQCLWAHELDRRVCHQEYDAPATDYYAIVPLQVGVTPSATRSQTLRSVSSDRAHFYINSKSIQLSSRFRSCRTLRTVPKSKSCTKRRSLPSVAFRLR